MIKKKRLCCVLVSLVLCVNVLSVTAADTQEYEEIVVQNEVADNLQDSNSAADTTESVAEEQKEENLGNNESELSEEKGDEAFLEQPLPKSLTKEADPETGNLRAELCSSKTTREYVDRTVVLTGTLLETVGEKIEYRFSEVYNGKETVLQDYSDKDSYTFKTSGIGIHTYYLNVRDELGNETCAMYEMEVVVHPDYVLSGKIVNNKTIREYVNRTVTLSGITQGGYGDIQYQFSESYNGKTSIVQEYSASTSYTFMTKDPGVHTFYLDIRDKEGQYRRYSYAVTVVIQPGYNLNGKIVSSKTPQEYVDRTVTLQGQVTGGYGALQYQYTEVYDGKTKVVKEYGDTAIYSFKTSGIGTHVFYLDVKDEKGQNARFSYTLNVYPHPNYVLSGTLKSTKTPQEYVRRTVTLSIDAAGGYGNLQYRYSEEYQGKTVILQDYSTEYSYTFVTKNPGTHIYYVDVKDEEGQVMRRKYVLDVYYQPGYILSGQIVSNKTNREYVNRYITLSGQVKGGYDSLQYRYIEEYAGSTRVVQDYCQNASYSFRTTQPGVHKFYLDVKDGEGQTLRCSYSLTVVVHPNYKLIGTLVSDAKGVVKEGQKIVLTATSSKGYSQQHLYRFRTTYGRTTTTVQDYSSETSYTFNIEGAGTHIYYVDIKDSEGQILTLSLNISLGKNGWFYENGYKFYYRNNEKVTDVRSIIGSQSSYVIMVNKQMSCITVYAKDGNKGYIIPVVAFACSPGSGTPTGTFYTQEKYRWHHLYGADGQFCTRITGHVLFHSPPYSSFNSYTLWPKEYNKLGTWASAGCVRLRSGDAKWIYDNCASGTKVVIYNSSTAGPLGKPVYAKIPLSQTWDPTDPYV